MALIGETGYTYAEDIELWGRAPEGWIHHRITDIAIDANDEVYVLIRGEPWVMVFNSDGELLRTWGDGMFTVPHGITAAPEGSIYTADAKDNRVTIFDMDGNVKSKLGEHLPWKAEGQIHFPHGMAVDSGRNIYLPGPPNGGAAGNDVLDDLVVTEFVLQCMVRRD